MTRHHGGDPYVMVDLSSNVNPLGLPRVFWEHYSRCGGRGNILTRYPDHTYTDLRNALAEFYEADPTRIVPTNGADEALLLTILLYARRNGLMVVAPNYGDWHLHARVYDIPLETHLLTQKPSREWHLDPQSLANSINKSRPGLLLASSPNNPTGANLIHSLHQALSQAPAEDTVLLLDQSYVELCPTCETSLEHYCNLFPNAILVRSLGKWLAAPGLRMGFAYACNNQHAQTLEDARPAWNVNSLADCTLTHLLTQEKTELQQYIAITRKYIEQTLPHIQRLLEKHGFTTHPTTANYILAHHPHAPLIIKRLQGRGVKLRDASTFTGLGPGYVRIALPDTESFAYLLTALEEEAEKPFPKIAQEVREEAEYELASGYPDSEKSS